MMKYIVFAAVFAVFVFAFVHKFIFEYLGKGELSPEKEIIVKSVCFLAVLAGTVYIIFAG